MGARHWKHRDQIKWNRVADVVNGTAIAIEETAIADTPEQLGLPAGAPALPQLGVGEPMAPEAPEAALAAPEQEPEDAGKWGYKTELEEVEKEGQQAQQPIAVRQKTWKNLKDEIPSLNGVLYEILNFKAQREALFIGRYGISKEQARKTFQLFVGYHPFYGCYALSVGPYFASKNAWSTMTNFSKDLGHDQVTPEDVEEALRVSEATVMTPDIDKKSDEYKKARTLLGAAKSVKADKANRISYFTRRFQRATKAEMETAAKKYIGAITGRLAKAEGHSLSKMKKLEKEQIMADIATRYGLNTLDWENDLRVKVKSSNGKKPQKNLKFESNTYKNLAGGDGQGVFDREPMLGTNSALFLNAGGLHKVMKTAAANGNWQTIYDQAIREVAEKNKVNPENAMAVVTNDVALMKLVLKRSSEIQKEMMGSGDPETRRNAEAMKQVPEFDLIAKGQRTGAQRFDALKTRTNQLSLARLKLEVLRTSLELNPSNGCQDPDLIAAELQKKRKDPRFKYLKQKGVIQPEVIKSFLAQIKAQKVLEGKSGRKIGPAYYAKLIAEIENVIKVTEEGIGTKFKEGFDSLIKAFNQAQLYLHSPGSDALDPQTKSEINALFAPTPDLLDIIDFGDDITSEKLTAWRAAADAGMPESQRLAATRVASPGDLELELGGEHAERVLENPDDKAEAVAGVPEDEVAEDEDEKGEGEEDEGEMELEEEQKKEENIPVDDLTKTPAVEAPVAEEVPHAEAPAEAVPEGVPAQENQFNIEELPQTKLPAQQPAAEIPDAVELDEQGRPKKKQEKPEKVINNVLGKTLVTLIKIAKDLDDHGRSAAAEQVHAVIRKYQKRV